MREEDITAFFEQETIKAGGLVLAAPEVPLDICPVFVGKREERMVLLLMLHRSDRDGECMVQALFYVDLLAIN